MGMTSLLTGSALRFYVGFSKDPPLKSGGLACRLEGLLPEASGAYGLLPLILTLSLNPLPP